MLRVSLILLICLGLLLPAGLGSFHSNIPTIIIGGEARLPLTAASHGDVFILLADVTLPVEGQIHGNVTAIGSHVRFQGTVQGNVRSVWTTLEMPAPARVTGMLQQRGEFRFSGEIPVIFWLIR